MAGRVGYHPRVRTYVAPLHRPPPPPPPPAVAAESAATVKGAVQPRCHGRSGKSSTVTARAGTRTATRSTYRWTDADRKRWRTRRAPDAVDGAEKPGRAPFATVTVQRRKGGPRRPTGQTSRSSGAGRDDYTSRTWALRLRSGNRCVRKGPTRVWEEAIAAMREDPESAHGPSKDTRANIARRVTTPLGNGRATPPRLTWSAAAFSAGARLHTVSYGEGGVRKTTNGARGDPSSQTGRAALDGCACS